MPQQIINIGTVAGDGTGDTLRESQRKANENFSEVYTRYAPNLGVVVPTDTPTGTGINYWECIVAGTYTNFGGVVLAANSRGTIFRNLSGVFSISQVAYDITSKVNVSDVINNLTSTSTVFPLSAAQGKVLNEKFDNKADLVLGKNKFNKDAAVQGFHFTETGSIVTNSVRCYSEMIPVLEGQVYKATHQLRFSCFFDINKNVVAGGGTFVDVSFTIPINVKFMVITIYITELPIFQLELNTISTTYESYLKSILESKIPLTISRTSDVVNNLTSTSTVFPLSAAQGKALNEKFYTKTEIETKNSLIYDILGEPILKSYPKDFSLLTTATTEGVAIWINNTPLSTRGKLSSLRVKVPVGSTVTPYVYSISGTAGSYVYTLLKTYTSFATTTLEQTQTITDAFVIEASQFIGFKSSLGIYYNTVGSAFTTGQPNGQVQTYSMDFVINEVLSYGLKDRVTVLEAIKYINNASVLALQNIVGKDAVLKSYAKDFTPITTLAAIGTAIWINKTDITTRGKLKQFRVKVPVGSLVTPYVYTVSGVAGSLVFTLNKTYNAFIASSLEHTEIITDDYIVEVGQLLGYKSSLGIYYKAGTSEKSYTVGNVSSDTHSYGYDFILDENTIYGLKDRVTVLEANQGIQTVILKPAVLYRNSLAVITDFVAVNWSVSSGVAVPTAIGIANHLWLQKTYNVTPRKMTIDAVLLADSVFDIHTASLSYPNGTGYFSIDVPANSLKIYSDTRTLIKTGVIPFTLVSGRKYTISLSIVDWKNSFEIKDSITSAVYNLEYQIETTSLYLQPRQNETYKFYLFAGTTTGVSISNMVISSKKNPLIWMGGDSITEGALFSTANFKKRFSVMLADKLKGNVLISARGGAIWYDMVQKTATEIAFIKPDYAMITIGTNAGLTAPNLTSVINGIVNQGVIPIINHIPNGNSYANSVDVNAIIDSVCLTTGAIRGCLFDVATSIGNNPANGGNPSLYDSDMIHPNALGQAEMFKRFEIDLPFLFL